MPPFPLWKDMVMTAAGLMGIAHQELGRAASDPGLLIVYAAMLGYGAPSVIAHARNNKKGGDS